jgi:energy-coupling factor transporter transmembrane protein EcfT
MIPMVSFIQAADRGSWLARLHPASKVVALPLACLSCFLVPAWLAGPLLALLVLALRQQGLSWMQLARTLRVWGPLVLLVVGIHTFATLQAAPLGSPSLQGLLRGVTAVARVMGSAACLVLFIRCTSLADLTAGLGWWGRPLRRADAAAGRVSLTLSIALATVPGVLAEGQRLEAVVRLRRGGRQAGGRRWQRFWRRALDRGCLVVPLIENLFRKADSLTLALQGRMPRPDHNLHRPPWRQLLALAVWSGLVVLEVMR